MSAPPRQCTVAIAAPSSRARAPAPATVLGMSCHLRSRNTCTPRARNSRARAGPSRTYSPGPSLAQRSPGRRWASASASRPLGTSKATTSSATGELPRDPLRDPRVGERGGADRNERGAGVEVGTRVLRRADAAHADHRQPHAVGDPPGGEYADRQQRRAADATRPVAQASVQHPGDGVDEADGVRAFLLGYLRHGGNVGEHGRELDHERSRRHPTAAAYQLGETVGVRPKLEPARASVRAGGVDLERRDRGDGREPLDHAHVIVHDGARHVDEHAGPLEALGEPRELAPRHLLESRIREAHRVEHSPAELGDARRRMPAPRLRGHGFGDDPPQRVEIDDPVDLAAEGRRPGGEEHGILEGRAEEADGERGGGRRAHGASSVGPRRPGTGGLTVAATASGGERNSKPSARARESSAAAYAGLASPRTASVYGEVGYRLDSSATKESWDWGSNPAAATSALGAKSELGASVTMRRNSRPASGALPSESRASSAARNSAASPLASSTSTRTSRRRAGCPSTESGAARSA